MTDSDTELYDAVMAEREPRFEGSAWAHLYAHGFRDAARVAARISAERQQIIPKPGNTIRINHGLGEGQITTIQSVVRLPMGLGLNVVLDGDYPATLNPADVEVIQAKRQPVPVSESSIVRHHRIGPGECACGFDAYRIDGIMLDYGDILQGHIRAAIEAAKESDHE